MQALQQELKRVFGSVFEPNKSLRHFSTLQTGGLAKYYFSVDTLALLEKIHAYSQQKGIPILPLGRGSNIIIQDAPLESFVVRLIEPKKDSLFSVSTPKITFFAGTSLSKALLSAQNACLAGMECICGIPGTIGGAVKMNAGTKLGEIKEILNRQKSSKREK